MSIISNKTKRLEIAATQTKPAFAGSEILLLVHEGHEGGLRLYCIAAISNRLGFSIIH